MGRCLSALVAAVLLLSACGSSSTGGQTQPKSAGHEATLGNEAPPPPAHTETTTAPRAPRRAASRPAIKRWFIPFGEKRKQETAAYARRHYGSAGFRLDPKLIVEHYSVVSSAQGVYDTFAPDRPDVELHELPQVCSHFLVDRDGTIYQFVPLNLICRHTVGLNYAAIGIEHVGQSDSDILGNPPQLRASLRLTTWLRCRYGIERKNVIGHNESLSSPYHHERVPALRSQTHEDWNHADMERYRALLAKQGCG